MNSTYSRFIRFIVLIIVILSFENLAAAENNIRYKDIRFKQLDQSLIPNNTIRTITQDCDGYMWFGTQDGLCRYDGYTTRLFSFSEEDQNTIPHNEIVSLASDSTHRAVWILTNNNISKYDIDSETIKRYNVQIDSFRAINIITLPGGDVFAVFNNVIFRYNEKIDSFERYITTAEDNFNIRDIVHADNKLWIATNDGLKCFCLVEQKYIEIPRGLDSKEISESSKLFILGGNSLWLSGSPNNKIYVHNILNNRTREISTHKKTRLRSACIDSDNNIWLGGEGGIAVFNSNLEMLYNFDQSNQIQNKLNDLAIYSIFKDNNNNIWIGTFFGGVNQYIEESDTFSIYDHEAIGNTLSGKAVREIISDTKGGIYVATEDGGVNHIDSKGKITRSEQLNKRLQISDLNTHSLLLDKEKNLWVGTFSQGAICIPPYDSQRRSNPIKDISIFSMLECSNGEIWIGCPRGVTAMKRNRKSGNIEITNRYIPQSFAYSMMQLNDSIVWVGTKRSSIKEININTNKVRSINIDRRKDLFITYLLLDRNRNVWVGTDKNGLYLLNRRGKITNHFGEDKLSNNSIKGIVEDFNGNIWVGTNRGLCMIDKEQDVLRYTVADGLPINQFNYSSAYIAESGEIFFGTINGMISFFPDDLKQKSANFNIQITQLVAGDNKPLPTKSREIELSHKQAQSLVVDFSGLNYQYGQRTQYAMLLEGVDKTWVNIGTQHQIRLSNLSAGNYKLNLKASTDGVNWDTKGQKSLEIIVHPVWWQSRSAYLAYFILALLAAYSIYKYLKNKMLLEVNLANEKQARRDADNLNKQKINFFTFVSHDLKTPLTLILSPLRKINESNTLDEHNKERLDVVYRNAVRMDYLIDELLNFSKIEMNQREILVRCGDIIQYLNGLSKIFTMVANEKEIEFNVDIKEYDKHVWFSPSKMERIIYNLLSNAFKYTAVGGHVTFSAEVVSKDGHEFAEIKVSDNGRGIPAEKIKRIFVPYYQVEKKDHREGFGLGLPLTRSLVKLHKGDIEVDSVVGEGSTFTITIPVSAIDYTDSEMSQEEITPQHMQKYNNIIKESIKIQSEQQNINAQKEQKKSILIVEDNKDMNQYVCSIFADEYNVTKAFDGAEACKILQKFTPDIIITDVMMPHMDGYELASHVRNDESTSHIPIIMLTAKTAEEDMTQGYQSGVDAYIKKPFNEYNLKLLVDNISTNRSSLISKFKSFAKLNIDDPATTPRDEMFIKQIIDLIMENLSNDEFSVADIIDKIKISRSQLHFKLKNIKGCSATQFIRSVKMNEAKNFMINGMNVSETSYAVGMLDPNYFTKCFKKEFDITPSDFIKQLRQE